MSKSGLVPASVWAGGAFGGSENHVPLPAVTGSAPVAGLASSGEREAAAQPGPGLSLRPGEALLPEMSFKSGQSPREAAVLGVQDQHVPALSCGSAESGSAGIEDSIVGLRGEQPCVPECVWAWVAQLSCEGAACAH